MELQINGGAARQLLTLLARLETITKLLRQLSQEEVEIREQISALSACITDKPISQIRFDSATVIIDDGAGTTVAGAGSAPETSRGTGEENS